MNTNFPEFLFDSTIVTDEMLQNDEMRGRICKWIASEFTGESAEQFDNDLLDSIESFVYGGEIGKSDSQSTLKQMADEYKNQ